MFVWKVQCSLCSKVSKGDNPRDHTEVVLMGRLYIVLIITLEQDFVVFIDKFSFHKSGARGRFDYIIFSFPLKIIFM